MVPTAPHLSLVGDLCGERPQTLPVLLLASDLNCGLLIRSAEVRLSHSSGRIEGKCADFGTGSIAEPIVAVCAPDEVGEHVSKAEVVLEGGKTEL